YRARRRDRVPPEALTNIRLAEPKKKGPVGETWFPPRLSGCPDLNWGPLRPERSALPGCATPRSGTKTSRFRHRSVTFPRLCCLHRQLGGQRVMNSVNLIGNLTTDVELREFGEDKDRKSTRL